MKHFLCALAFCAAPAYADSTLVAEVVDHHILPRFEALAQTSAALSEAAEADCAPTSPALRAAYGTAFDAWVSASHLRFGPTEADDRAFALAFWPDSRGVTPRALGKLLADADPVAETAERYGDVSIAARGFYALEFLLYDDAVSTAGDPAYHCTLVQTVSADIAATTAAILADWQAQYRSEILTPSPDGRYHTDDEAVKELFKALSTGLLFTADTRMGRPLGSFERPRPTRAEARRSGRSARHVALSLIALQDLAGRLAGENEALSAALNQRFSRAIAKLDGLDDPTFASVEEPQGRFKVEIVQQRINQIRSAVADELGPTLGVTAGFNALDGD